MDKIIRIKIANLVGADGIYGMVGVVVILIALVFLLVVLDLVLIRLANMLLFLIMNVEYAILVVIFVMVLPKLIVGHVERIII
jgi:hypothetical protein